MNTSFAPLLADTMAFAERMNAMDFTVACCLATLALILSFLPRRWRAGYWLSIGSAVVSIYVVIWLVRNNNPPWQPAAVMMVPAGLSLLAAGLSLRALFRKPKP